MDFVGSGGIGSAADTEAMILRDEQEGITATDGALLPYRVAPTTGGQVRPFVFANPVDAGNPSSLQLTAGEAQTVVTPDSGNSAAVITSNDASVPGFPQVTLASFMGWPAWEQLIVLFVVGWLLWEWLK